MGLWENIDVYIEGLKSMKFLGWFQGDFVCVFPFASLSGEKMKAVNCEIELETGAPKRAESFQFLHKVFFAIIH